LEAHLPMTMLNRAAPESDPEATFTAVELQLLDRLITNTEMESTHRGGR
jgi:hypothetical protein